MIGPDESDEPTQEQQDAYDRTLPAAHIKLGAVIDRDGWRCLACGLMFPTIEAVGYHVRQTHELTDEGRRRDRSAIIILGLVLAGCALITWLGAS